MAEMKNVLAYVRVSTDGQTGEDKFGIDEQKEIIMNYCNKNNMQISQWYIDEISGAAESRPEFDKILYSNISNPPIESVVVAKSDRVARDIKLYFYYMMLLEKRSISLISATEEVVNDDTGLGNVYKSLMLFVAEQERKNITRRTMGGRRQKSKRGGYSGGRPPFGYIADGGRIIIDPKNADIVIRIYKLRAMGKTYKDIIDYLKYSGYKTLSGGDFYISNIQQILGNRKRYEGFHKYGDMKEWVKGQHEPILTPEIIKELKKLELEHMTKEQREKEKKIAEIKGFLPE